MSLDILDRRAVARHGFRRWWVYVYDPVQHRHAEVGKVFARSASDALHRAREKWPDKCDYKNKITVTLERI